MDNMDLPAPTTEETLTALESEIARGEERRGRLLDELDEVEFYLRNLYDDHQAVLNTFNEEGLEPEDND